MNKPFYKLTVNINEKEMKRLEELMIKHELTKTGLIKYLLKKEHKKIEDDKK